MKTSKRKRSSKSEPAAAISAEPVVALDTTATQPVVAESVVAANDAVGAEAVAASEPGVATAVAEPVIVLSANCSVKDAAALKVSLCAIAKESAAVTLDTSAVERVDTATMQLLCAFVRDRSSRNQGIVWRGKSQALSDAVRLLGVGALLALDQVEGVAA
jgi:ABC-type transporter Mla MlaB component